MSRKHLSLILLIFLVISLPHHSKANPGTDPGYRILVPGNLTFHGYPVLKPLDPKDPRMTLCRKIFEGTFVREIVRINRFIQQYRFSEQKITSREPVYLLISGRMGGYPMHGFYLLENGKLFDKTGVGYVDLQEVEKNFASLSSITQIFPHEQAHIFYSQLTGLDPGSVPSYSSDIHYYSIITDYFKAFNEGFAESFENVSRDNEKDSAVRQGIMADILSLKKSLDRKRGGFERDYQWPVRAGFYRATMLLWYQQLENYKRSEWTNDNLARFLPGDPGSTNPEKAIHFRNACVNPDTSKIRNLAQAAATEGVVCTFFTKMIEAGLKKHYAARDFYIPFVKDTNDLGDPHQYFTPVENEVLKELYVVRKYLGTQKENDSPLFLFINGYIREFPAEKDEVLGIFRDVTSHPYTGTVPPELWVLSKDHSHSFMVMAPYGGAESSFYTFNLNTAEAEDLMTLRGIAREDALKIIHYRDSAGCFRSFNDLSLVPGLEQKTIDLVKSNKLNPSDLKNPNESEGMNLTNIILFQLKPFGLMVIIVSLVTTLLLYSGFYLRRKPARAVMWMFLRTTGKVIIFMLIVLASLILVAEPFLLFGAFAILVIILNLLRTRKSQSKRIELLMSTAIIILLLGYSLI